jgi:FlaA1/EpsC-like NDP-sugar epimerase
MKIQDLFEIFSEKYNKPIEYCNIRSGEKLLESLVNETQSLRLKKIENYMHILSVLECTDINEIEQKDYNSKINTISKEDLKQYLIDLNLY